MSLVHIMCQGGRIKRWPEHRSGAAPRRDQEPSRGRSGTRVRCLVPMCHCCQETGARSQMEGARSPSFDKFKIFVFKIFCFALWRRKVSFFWLVAVRTEPVRRPCVSLSNSKIPKPTIFLPRAGRGVESYFKSSIPMPVRCLVPMCHCIT